jgi:TPR repeat protein
LGFAYYFGEGDPEDMAEAVKWWLLAAEQGHAEAQFNLWVVYGFGEGVSFYFSIKHDIISSKYAVQIVLI